MSRSFNPEPTDDAPTTQPLYETIEIGFEHEVVDGAIVYTLDPEGQRVPRTYQVSVRPTPREVLTRVGNVTPEAILALGIAFKISDGVTDAMATILEQIAGSWVRTIYEDPTVDPDQASKAIGWLLDIYGLTEIMQMGVFLATADDEPVDAHTEEDVEEEDADGVPFDVAG